MKKLTAILCVTIAMLLRSYGISEAGAVLVRPDGYVGWRKKGSSDNPIAELTEAYERLLSKK